MTVISLDLAIRRYEDNGLAVMTRRGASIGCEVVPLAAALPGAPAPDVLADHLAALAERVSATCILIDGPQAWKHDDNGLVHQRSCEGALRTPGKTGPPGVVKPRTWTRFAEFSIALFDALEMRGWPRLREDPGDAPPAARFAVESFPTAAWRALDLTPLPAKTRCDADRIREAHDALRDLFPIETDATPSHDELQAIIAGLAGLALEDGGGGSVSCAGLPPCRVDGVWREGYIVLPLPPDAGVR